MHLSISHRIFLLTIVLVVLTGGIVTLVFYQSSTDILVKHALEELTDELAQENLTLTARTETLQRDILFLAKVPPIQGIIRASQNQGLDIEGNSTLQEWRTRLEQIFTYRLVTTLEYFQIRFINASGQELVRTERIDDEIIALPEGELQNKKGRNYVTQTLQLTAGQTFLSNINLNREHGRIMEPYLLTLRIGTPVFDNRGKLFGLVVINLDFGSELQHISTHHNLQTHTLFVADDRGSYLVHPDPNKLYGNDLGRGDRLQHDIPQLSTFFEPDSGKRNITLLPEQTHSKFTMVFRKIPLGRGDSGRFIILGLAQEYDDIVAVQRAALTTAILWSLLLILAGIPLAYGISKLEVKPLKQINQGINDFRQTLSSGALPVNRGDEIGELARSFAELMDQVRSSQQQLRDLNYILEDHVRNRTQELELAEIRQRTVLNTMVEALITIDDMGMVESFNPAAEKMLGYRAEEVIGENISMLMPEPYASEHDGYLKHYKETGEARILGIGREAEARRSDGSVFPIELAVSEMWLGKKRMFSGIVRDITERKRVEKIKNEFISTVSHELRTPLTSIRGSLGLITGGAIGELPEKIQEMLKIASNNTERLLLLINDILDIQKIESGQMAFRFKTIELMPLIKQALSDCSGYAEQHNIRFLIRKELPGVFIFADPDRLSQVVSNLLSNAAKYSPEGDVVEISLAHHQGRVRLSVTDHGPGIPEEFHDRLFEKFTQSDSSDTRQKGGTGLGLNISKAIVEKHGGQISFITKEGIGTTFFVDLPALTPETMTEEPPKQLETHASTSVLIIEDDPDIAALIQRMLTEAGMNGVIAPDAEQALAALRSQPRHYQAVTLDINLPGEDGISLLHRLRQSAETYSLPVIIISVEADNARQTLNGGAVGVVDWLTKPIDEQRLKNAVRQAARLSKIPQVLHVEDESDIHQVVKSMLQDQCELTWAKNLAQAREQIMRQRFDLVLLDIKLPDGSGLDLLCPIEKQDAPPQVIIFSAYDVTEDYAEKVSAVLKKTCTSNKDLASIIIHTINQQNPSAS